MDLELGNSVAVVAGGTSGIGHAVARLFAAEGAHVALIDTAEATAAAARDLARGTGTRSIGVRCDITDYAALLEARDEIARGLGGWDHVVGAAAVGSGKFGYPFLNLSPADWPRVLEVNLLGAVHLAHAFAPALMERRRGTFTFLGSVAGQFGSQTDPPYSASKAALFNFCQCLAKDLAPSTVRANVVNPGMVRTPLNRSVWEAWNRLQPPAERRSYEEWAGEKVRRVVPLGRWQEPEDIAWMVLFLASPRARNVTGQVINVDGGFIMHS